MKFKSKKTEIYEQQQKEEGQLKEKCEKQEKGQKEK